MNFKLYTCRVLEVSSADVAVPVIDPTPDNLYMKRKLESLTGDTTATTVNQDLEPTVKLPTSGWDRCIPQTLSFDDVHIKDYALNSGKRAFKTPVDHLGH